MIDIDKNTCCGCSACAQVCPQKAIEMKTNEEGFLYPFIDSSKCVSCGLCERVCPISATVPNVFSKNDTAIGGWNKDETVLKDSSSGGAFSLFADYVIGLGGGVIGCALDEKLVAKHILIEKKEDIEKLRGSKYVQSDVDGAYQKAEALLRQNRPVLFVGTPCQAKGLYLYIGTKYAAGLNNLYICDFICHGTPSPKIFGDYVEYLEKTEGEKITGFKFRNKIRNWNPSGMQQGTVLITASGREVTHLPAYNDSYMNGFLDDLYLRPSCYNCASKEPEKYYSDFTIADFWGVNKSYPELNNPKGTSLILFHSDKGRQLFENVKEGFYFKEVDVNKAVKKNKPLRESMEMNPNREQFFSDYEKPEMDFGRLSSKYMTAFKWASHKAIKLALKIYDTVVRNILGVVLKLFGIKPDEKKWKSILQFTRFCLVGVSNAAVSYLLNITTLLILRPFGWKYDYVVGNTVAFLLSVLWSYHWNSSYVFRLGRDGKKNKAKTLAKTYLSYAFSGIVLNNLLGTLWIQVLGLSKFISPLLNLPITVPVNFLLNKLWAYKEKK